MTRFRKKPVEIEAAKCSDLLPMFEKDWKALPEWVADAYENGVIVAITDNDLTIKTLEGDHLARRDDWVIRGVKGEIYPCKPDIFEATYDPSEDDGARFRRAVDAAFPGLPGCMTMDVAERRIAAALDAFTGKSAPVQEGDH